MYSQSDKASSLLTPSHLAEWVFDRGGRQATFIDANARNVRNVSGDHVPVSIAPETVFEQGVSIVLTAIGISPDYTAHVLVVLDNFRTFFGEASEPSLVNCGVVIATTASKQARLAELFRAFKEMAMSGNV